MRCLLVALVLVVAVQCAERTAANSCPKSLVETEDNFYLQVEGDLCYFFGTYTDKYYNDAYDTCKRDGGHLVMPKSQAENDYILKKLKNTYRVTSETWIGLDDKSEEGTWEWVDGSKLDWENFADNNGPTHNSGVVNAQARLEDCAAIKSDGTWHDYQCNEGIGYQIFSWISNSDTKKNFVCQYVALVLPAESKDDLPAESKDDENKDGGDSSDNDPAVVSGSEDENVSPTSPVQVNQTISVQGNVTLGENAGGNQTTKCKFHCDLDCGMNGYQVDENECQVCKCNGEE